MARLQGILFFSHARQGWSEVYPLSATTYPTGQTAIEALRDARLAMVPLDVTCLGYRLSDIDVKGDSLVDNTEEQGTYGGASVPPAVIDQPTTVIRIRSETTDHLHRGIRFLHGVPDDVVKDGQYTPDMAFTTAMTTYLALLVTSVDIKNTVVINPGPPKVVVYTFFAIGVASVDKVWSRKIGRPFGVHPGKQRTT